MLSYGITAQAATMLCGHLSSRDTVKEIITSACLNIREVKISGYGER